MKKTKAKNTGKAALELYGIVALASFKVLTKKMNKGDVGQYCLARFKGVQRKYGFHNCLSALPDLIKKIEENPTSIMMNGTEKIKVPLIYDSLIEYHDTLAHGKANGI